MKSIQKPLIAALVFNVGLLFGENNVSSGNKERTIFVPGNVKLSSGIESPGYWKNGTWIPMQMMEKASYCGVLYIAVDGSNVYAAGHCITNPVEPLKVGLAVAGYWKNGQWTALPKVDDSKDSHVRNLFIVEGNIYITGTCKNAKEETLYGFWKNGIWKELKLKVKDGASSICDVSTMDLFGNYVISGGVCVKYTNGGNEFYPGYWKNEEWYDLPNPGSPFYRSPVSPVVIGEDIYFADGIEGSNPGYWKNGHWFELTLPGKVTSGFISILISGSDMYNVGSRMGNNKMEPGYLKNGVWVGLPCPDDRPYFLSVITLSGNNVYASGHSYDIFKMGLKRPELTGYWENGTWISLRLPEGAESGFSGNMLVKENFQ